MATKVLLEYVMFAELLFSSLTLVVMWRRQCLRAHYSVACFLGVNVIGTTISLVTLFFRKFLGISQHLDYDIFFYSRWTGFFLLSGLMLVIVYSIFRHAMKPLEGLHKAGKVVFRWIFTASLLVSIAIAASPHMGGGWYFQSLASQIQQATSILTLCLLLFVCFATRYLGMTYRSHIFGVSLGLGVMATVSLVESAFFTMADAQPLYSAVYLYSALGTCVALLVWGVYFAMPEPAARMIMLPTTSPYFTWNRISEVLGDDPGQVVIAGFTPDMLAPSELAVLTSASQRLQERNANEESDSPLHSFVLQG